MLVAVILTYAAPDGVLEACVDSVLRAGGIDRVVVVDNGDQAMRRLAGTEVEGRRATVLRTGVNLGYAGGMNVGIEWARAHDADRVLVLNDDVEVEPGFVAPLVAELDAPGNERVGAVQPKLLYAQGDPPIVNSLGVHLGRDGAGVDIGIGEPDDPGSTEARDVEACTGGALLLRRAFLDDVGAFDTRYFLYYEDVDLALRGAARGWRFRCVPASVVRHHGSATAGHADAAARTVFLRERNRLWVLLRYRPMGDVARGIWLSVRRLRHHPRGIHARALIAGLSRAPALLWRRVRAD